MGPSKLAHKRYWRWHKPFWRLDTQLIRIAAFTLLLVYLTLTVLAYRSTLEPGSLTFRIGLCDDTPCVSWVMPAGHGWDQGARPGMVVQSVNGRDITSSDIGTFSLETVREAELVRSVRPQAPMGAVLSVVVPQNSIAQSSMKFSLWILGGMFALLGAAVVVRRPDLYIAKVFGLFAGLTALALGVAPSAGGPAPPMGPHRPEVYFGWGGCILSPLWPRTGR